jgi:hypothetical protein
MFRRTRYQQGSVQREKRQKGPDVWVYRWYEVGSDGGNKYRKVIVGNVGPCPPRLWRSKQLMRCASTLTKTTCRQSVDPARLPNSLHTTG